MAGLDKATFEPRLRNQDIFAAIRSILHLQVGKAMTASIKTLSQLSTGTRHQQQHQHAQVAGPRVYKNQSDRALQFIFMIKPHNRLRSAQRSKIRPDSS